MTRAARGTRAAFGWYGSEARLTPTIAAIQDRVHVRPYAGSAAVRKPCGGAPAQKR